MSACRLAALCLGAALAPAGAAAADPFYLGVWKFSGAVVAPWVDPGRTPDRKEVTRLLDKTVALKPKEIAGPQPFACKGAHYEESDVPADALFQGAFEEMKSKDPSVDPNKIAAALGFTGTSFKTLETGCEIDFHFVDAKTAEVGLNDYVYTLKKQ